jgi:predicted  nucleic acid-binding Zn-ribbon protein
MSNIFGKLKSGAGKVAQEAKEAAQVKRIELDIGGLKKQIEAQYHQLGEMTYHSSINNSPLNPESANIISKITNLFEQIRLKEEEIKKISAEISEPQTPAQAPSATSQKKVCTSCGKENDPNVKFCSECGTKLA